MTVNQAKNDNLTYYYYCKVAYYRTLNRLQLLFDNGRITKDEALKRAKYSIWGLKLDTFTSSFK